MAGVAEAPQPALRLARSAPRGEAVDVGPVQDGVEASREVAAVDALAKRIGDGHGLGTEEVS